MLALDKRYYLDATKTKVVDEGSEEAAYLLGVKGHLISEEDAAKLGLGSLKAADLTSHMVRAENSLPHRVNLNVVQQYAVDPDAEPVRVNLNDPNRTALEAVSARVEAQRREQAEGEAGSAEKPVGEDSGENGPDTQADGESASGDDSNAETEQPRSRRNRG